MLEKLKKILSIFNKENVNNPPTKMKNKLFYFAKEHWDRIIIIGILFFYFIKLFYFSEFFIIRRVPIDEAFHLNFISALKNPFDIFYPEKLRAGWGTVSRMGFLYHFLGAILIKLNFFLEDARFLRFINMLLAGGYIYFFFRLISILFNKDKLAIILALIVQTSLLKFTFISGLITYDNLVNFLSIGSIYFLIKTIKENLIQNHLLLAIFLMLGSLTKVSFLPLFFAIGLIYMIYFIKNHKKIKNSLFDNKILTSICIFLFIVNGIFIAENFFKYGKPILPKCDKIYEYKQCQTWYSFKRSERFKKELNPSKLVPVSEYFKFWSDQMIQTTFGLPGFPPMIHSRELHRNILIVLILTIIVGLFINRKQKNKILLSLLFIVIFHLLILFYQNYKGYLTNGQMYAGLHGRYAFSILGALIILYSKYTIDILRYKWLKLIGVLSIGIFLVYNEFYFYITNPLRVYMENDVYITKSRVQPFKNSQITGGLYYKNQIQQIFTAKFDNLKALSVYFSTFGKTLVDSYNLNLYQNSCLSEKNLLQSIPLPTQITDNRQHIIPLSTIPDSKGKVFCFTIFPQKSDIKKPVTVHIGNTDKYRDGYSIFNKIKSVNDIAFDAIFGREAKKVKVERVFEERF